MGILNRRTILLGVAVAGGAALLLDKSLIGTASAMTGDLTGLVAEAQQATSIVQTLNSGDPVQIQDLLNRLVSEEGATPEAAQAGLFGGFAAAVKPEPAADPVGTADIADPVRTESDSGVSMIISTTNGGLAVINGKPMREGDRTGDLMLLAVHPDRVVVEEHGHRRVIRLATP